MSERKMKYLPMKPAVGGMPASESMKMSNSTAADGLRWYKPFKSSSSSPMRPFCRNKMRMEKAPAVIKRYANRLYEIPDLAVYDNDTVFSFMAISDSRTL